MKHVFNIDSVEEGMVTQSSIKDPQSGVLLVPAGTALTDKYIEILKRRGVKEIEVSFNDNIELKKQSNEAVNSMLMKEACYLLDGLNKDSENLDDILEKAGKIVDSVLVDTKLYKAKNEPSNHAVRVAAYATAVAKEYNKQFDTIRSTKEREEKQISLEQIATAALLHDIGKLCSDSEVRNEITDYIDLSKMFEGLKDKNIDDLKNTYDEKYIPYYGYNILYNNRKLSQSSKVMVLLSEEDEIGGGPLEAKFNQKERDSHVAAAKIINMCSLFDEYLVSDIKNHKMLETIYDQMDSLVKSGKFNYEFLNMLMKTIPFYKNGTVNEEVKLYALYYDELKEEASKQDVSEMLNETEELHGKAM